MTSDPPGDPRRALTLGDVLAERARSQPDLVAAVDGPVRLTWTELDARVDRVAGGLAAAGVEPGDVVAWLGQNSFRVLELLLACARRGAVLVPVNWRQSVDELAFVLDDADPRLVVWQQAEVGERVAGARARAATGATWIRHDGPGAGPVDGPSEYEGALATAEPVAPVPVADTDAVLMIYTAAFEGRPNGALLSHRAWITQNLVTALVQGYSAATVYLSCGPLFHVGTLRHTLATFQLGGTNVFVPRVDAAELCRTIAAEGCTGAFLERPTIDQVVEANRALGLDLSSLRTAPVSPEWDAMVTAAPPAVSNGFGQTELAGVVLFRGLGGPSIGGAGRPSPVVEVEVVDADDAPVAPGETGEIVVRGPVVMNGYHRRPELTADRHRGGWHHTHDLGRREVDGSISFVGPVTRIIKSAAENIYPAEVEGCLRAHPAVRDAGVIGVPDPTWGQSVVAVVALDEGRTATPEELVAHCRERIASYKKPKRVELVDALPRTAAGGVDHAALDETYGGGGYPSR